MEFWVSELWRQCGLIHVRAARVGPGELEEGRGPGLFLVSISQPCANWQSQASSVLGEKECAVMNLSLPGVFLGADEKQTDG